jgi:TonB family protein
MKTAHFVARFGIVAAVVVMAITSVEAQSAPPELPSVEAPAPAPVPVTQLPVTPPVLVSAAELTLPEGMQREGAIDVLLSIDVEGRVTEVELPITLGAAADEAVVQAARELRFAPARRGEQAIAAKVRFRFEIERSTTTTGATTPTTTPAATTAATVPLEVVATDQATPSAPEASGLGAIARVDKPPPGAASRVKLRGRELTMVPGTFGEPLRVVATLPGVARSPFGLGFFLVRGAAFQNTGFFVDGFSVPILYHLGAGPAIISSRLVDQLDFYPGGYPVSYGRYTAGVIALKTAPPPTDRVQLEVEVDLLRASALAIVPFGDGDQRNDGSVAVAFRRSYFELFLPLITDDVELSYTDYQLRLDYSLTPKLRASLFFFGSRDALDATATSGAGATTGSSGGGLRYSFDQAILSFELRPERALSLKWSGTVGPAAVEFETSSPGDASLGTETRALRLGQRLEAVYAPSELAQTTLGVEESVFLFDVEGSIPSFGELPAIPTPAFDGETFEIRDNLAELAIAPYLEQVVRPGPFEISGGLRTEYLRYGDVGTWAIDPRGVVRLEIFEGAKLKAATGLFAQPPLPFQVTRNFANPKLKPSRAWQSSVGAELVLPELLEIDTSLFYSAMYQLARPTGRVDINAEGNTVRPFFADDGKGRAYGWELMLRRRAEEGLFGWLSYTLSRSERFLEGGETVVFNFDQTHVLNVAMSYATGGWTFGARYTLASGRPVGDLLDPEGDDAVYDADEDDIDADSRGRTTRLPLFHQLDVRIDRAFTLGPLDCSVFLDIINLYNAANSESWQYQYDYTRRAPVPGIPFLPTIGLRGVL